MDVITEKRRRFIIDFVYTAIFVGMYYVIVKYALGYLFPFVFAAALSVFLQKPVKAITRKLHVKAHSAVSVILVLLIVTAIVGTVGVGLYVLANELKDFFTYIFSQFSSVTELVEKCKGFLLEFSMKLPKGVGGTVGGYVERFFDKMSNQSSELDLSMLSAPISGAWHVVKGIPSLFLSVLVTVISCVFMTSDYEQIKNMLLGMMSNSNAAKLVNAKRTVTRGVGKLFKAYATIMLITFTEMFIGLSFMKLIGVYTGGYIAIIAFVTCIVDIVPVLGTGTVVFPWAVYCFLTGDVGLGIGLLVLYGVITVLRQIIEPKLVANQVGLPAIVTIAAMFIGARIFGTFGIIILPLTVIVLKLMYDEGIVGNKATVQDSGSKEYSEEGDSVDG